MFDATSHSPSVPQEMLNFARQFSARCWSCFPIPYMVVHPAAGNIATVTKQSWHLLPSALPEVQLLFEDSHQTRVVSDHGSAVLLPSQLHCW